MGARWIILGSIKGGDTSAFAEVAKRMHKVVQDQEPGAITYDWFASEDGSSYVVEEHYADEESFNLHIKNSDPLMPEFLKIATIEKIIVLGDIPTEAGEMLASRGAILAPEVVSLNR